MKRYVQNTKALTERFLNEAQALHADGASGVDWLCFELGVRCADYEMVKTPAHLSFEALRLAGFNFYQTQEVHNLSVSDPTIPALVAAMDLFKPIVASKGPAHA